MSIFAKAFLPTRFGDFTVVSFQNNCDEKEHIALVKGNVSKQCNVLVRIHSECLTGDVLGSLKCDCRDQLEYALNYIGKKETGILLYLRQEGRGIGLKNKIKAYELQEKGADTVEANKLLGYDDDERTYEIAAHMLQLLNVSSIKLMTNNPDKITALKSAGINVTERIPITTTPNTHNAFYLDTKKKRMGHLL